MTNGQVGSEDALSRRRRAEELFRSRTEASPEELGPPEATLALLHELRVHQIELELQNEELRRIQDELERSRARYFDLYDVAPVGYLTVSDGSQIREANLTAATLLGASRSELVGQALTRFILPEDQDVYYHHRRRLFGGDLPRACELRLGRTDRDPIWVRLQSTAPEELGDERVCRTALSDITERKRAELTLEASESRHRLMFETSRDALMTLSPPDWRFTSGNASALAMFGAIDEPDFERRTLWHYSPELQPDGSASAQKAAAMIETAMSEGSHFCLWTFERSTGEKFVATILMTRLELDGQPQLQATVRDETQMKRLEAVLGQADRLASMGMLAAGVAHEINNPLTYVLYNVESLTNDLPRVVGATRLCSTALRSQVGEAAFAAMAGEHLEVLQGSTLEDMVSRAREALAGTQRIKIISRALGTFSRVESVERGAVDLNYAVECAITMAFNEIKYRARLIKDLTPMPAVWASEGKLSQVFLNLLINASHSIEEGMVDHNRIIVRSWTKDGDAFAEVKDTGKGIPAENLNRIFEPFFTTKPIGMGSGLGLAICRNIVSDFGGDIRVESEVGKGTRFVVRVPLHVRKRRPTPVLREATQERAARGRILVVDDEDLILATMQRVLGEAHEVVLAASGEAGRDILDRDQAFDVILCDLMMPEMTGMALHQWLASRNPGLADRMVFVTGGAFTPKTAEYLARVQNSKLDKPIDAALLRRLVAHLVLTAREEASSVE